MRLDDVGVAPAARPRCCLTSMAFAFASCAVALLSASGAGLSSMTVGPRHFDTHATPLGRAVDGDGHVPVTFAGSWFESGACELYVDGVQLPTPALQGVTITDNKIWSANTGRLEQTGTMAGTIVTIKRKAEIKWPPLSMAQMARIRSAVSNLTPFHSLRMTDAEGQEITMTVYFGDISGQINSYSAGFQRIEDVSVSAIEQ